MAYQVIARKFRPQIFDDLVGQEHVSRTLLNALRSGRLHPVLLFTGPRGVGKTSTARIVAKSLNCPQAKDFVPCNTCEICQEIASGSTTMNVQEIDGASHNSVEDIRELRNGLGYMPSTGRYKVYIIDEVHMLSTSAFNALLKTTEEPPAHVIFIFATTEPQKIPATILSRCQRFDFRRIPTRILAERLKLICEKEQVVAEPEALWTIARQADGSARDSQSLLDQIITFCSDGGKPQITNQKTVEILGLTDRGLLLQVLRALVERSTQDILGIIEKLYYAGFDSRVFVQDLLESLRNLLMVKLSPHDSKRLVDLAESEVELLKQLSQQLSEEDIHLLFDMALKGAQDLQRAQDPKMVLELVLLRIAAAPRVRELTGLTALKKSPESATTKPVASPPLTAAPTATPVAPKVESDRWTQTIEHIRKSNPALAAKLEHVALVQWEASVLKLGVVPEKKFLVDFLSDKKTISELQRCLQEVWDQAYQLQVELTKQGPLSPVDVQKKNLKEQQDRIRSEVEQHPLVKKPRELFNAQITEIKELQQ